MKKAAQAGFHVAARVMRSPTPEEAAVIGQQYMRTRTLKKAQVQKAIGLLAESSDRYHMTEMSAKDALNTRANQLMNDPQRRAIYSVNSYLNIFGIPRPNFWKQDNDRLARNAIYAVCEKRIMDTIETIEWDVTDHQKETVDSAVRFLKRPNPQDTFQTLIKQTIPDVLRYDQAVWVKTRAIDGHLMEFKAYSGPEFWIEVDNKFDEIQGQYGLQYYGPWSHGYVKRYWQHSRPGIYIPFAVRDICMIMMYKRADSIYGTDFLQQLKWQLEALIDSTKAAGMTFANGVGPSLWWKHPDLSSLEQLEERNMEVELENKGPENAGNILHLLGQEEIGTIFPSLLDLQWLDGQKFLSSIVWAMFGFAESEFNSSDANRATAYINNNITKSKMLAPLLRHLETVINTEILPELEGYQEGWTFAFKAVQELDDKLKEVQVEQGRADVLGKLVALNVPLEEAMRIAKYEEEQITAVTTSVNTVTQQENSSMESAFQNLLQANGMPPDQKIGNAPPGNQQPDNPIDSAQAPVLPPDQGGMPHAEKYTGQVRNDSGKPEDDGQTGKKRPPFEKADFKEDEHPRADDGKFGSGQGNAKESPQNPSSKEPKEKSNLAPLIDKQAGKSHADKVESSLPESMWTYGTLAASNPAVDEYFGDGYREINDYLRNERGDPRRSVHKTADQISAIISRAPVINKGTELYRGVGIKSGQALANAEIGSTCNDKAFQSYSLNPNVAADFANTWDNKDGKKHTTIIKAVSDGSQHAVYTNAHKPPEYEMLLDKGTSWKVTGNNSYEQNGIVYHVVEVVPNV
jgi:hypothetical protein